MSKRRDGKGATFLVFPVIFNILFFLLKPDMSQGAVWVNYAIIQAAYILLSLRSKSGERQLPILGLSLKLVFFWYFIYALVVGVVLIAAAPDLLWLTLVLQLIPAGLIVLLTVAIQSTNRKTVVNDAQARQQISFIRVNLEALQRAKEQASGESIKKTLERLHTALQASPLKSHESVASLEADITDSIVKIIAKSGTDNGETIMQHEKQIITKLSERNSKLGLLNM